MAVVDTATELPPFGASVDGVTALVPEVRLYNAEPPMPAGTYAVTAAQVAEWVAELSDSVAMALDGWEGLTNVAVYDVDEVTLIVLGDRDRFIGNARTIVHNGAASYLEAARRPEQANRTTTSYAEVLWARYLDGLDRLSAWLIKRLADPEPGDDPGPDAGSAAFSFPCPTFPDHFAV